MSAVPVDDSGGPQSLAHPMQQTENEHVPRRVIPRTIVPPDASNCVLLQRCFNPATEIGSSWVQHVSEDIRIECEKYYGRVTAISPFESILISRFVLSTLMKFPVPATFTSNFIPLTTQSKPSMAFNPASSATA